MKAFQNTVRIAALAACLPLMGCVGAQVSTPLTTNAGRVSSLKSLGYTELGFPEGGLQVGTLVIYDPARPDVVTVMCSDKTALNGINFENIAGPAEWSGARALDVGVASSFLDKAVTGANLQSVSKDSVVLKNIRKNLMTKQNIYTARLQPGCAGAIERYFNSEDERVLGLVHEVLRGDIESSSSMDLKSDAKLQTPLTAVEGHINPSAESRVLATDLVFGFKVDTVAAREIAQVSGVRIPISSPQIERILVEETRPKYERLLKRGSGDGGLSGEAWDKLSFRKRVSLAQEFGQIFTTKVVQADRPSEDLTQAQAVQPEVQP